MKNSNSVNRNNWIIKKMNEAMNIPSPKRAAKIQFLKERVQKGAYKVDAEKVAQSILLRGLWRQKKFIFSNVA